jgi:beta-xylosidase
MKRLKIMYLLLLMISSFLSVGCGGGNDAVDNGGDIIIGTPTLSNVTSSSADVSATITGTTTSIIKKGFCYATTENPTISSTTVEVSSSFSATLSNLTANTTYYIRAFAYDGTTVYYSSQLKFSTSAATLADELSKYVAPTYADDYVSIAGWENRSQWNLSNVHDPSVMKADDGYYYMYQTDASYGNAHDGHGHFFCRRSKDLVNWEFLGSTMSAAPSWVKTKLNEYRAEMGLSAIDNPSYGYWAPVARKVSTGKYRMYYCIVVNNYIKTGADASTAFDGSWSERAFIGMMETSDPASNTWEDKGFVVCSSTDKGMNEWSRSSTSDWSGYFKINAIDPTFIITPSGEHWLIYGSWHSGIAAMQLNPETGKPLKALGKPWAISGDDNSGYGKMIVQRGTSRWQASEGPEVVYHDGYYYLFLAYDALSVPYNTRVCRSTNIDGPYTDMDGNAALGATQLYPIMTAPYKFNNSYGWVGISHCAVFDDGAGNWFYSSQGRFPENVGGNAYSNAIMMGQVRSIRWTSTGWPLVMPERYGNVPKAPIAESELNGNWEHIALNSSVSTQKTSETMTFDVSTHKITAGSWKGATWTFDASTQTVTTSAGVVLYLQREVDWEASPRTHTIVYAALGNDKTYWGKKVK